MVNIMVERLFLGDNKITLFGSPHTVVESIEKELEKEIKEHNIILLETAGKKTLRPKFLGHKVVKNLNEDWEPLDGEVNTEKLGRIMENNPFLLDSEKKEINEKRKNENISDITENKRRQNYILKVLEERDFRFALKILEVVKENLGKSIIAVMGGAHISGTKEYLKDEDLENILI